LALFFAALTSYRLQCTHTCEYLNYKWVANMLYARHDKSWHNFSVLPGNEQTL